MLPSCLVTDERPFSGRHPRNKCRLSFHPACWRPPIPVRYPLTNQWTLRPRNKLAPTRAYEKQCSKG